MNAKCFKFFKLHHIDFILKKIILFYVVCKYFEHVEIRLLFLLIITVGVRKNKNERNLQIVNVL
jgi:hypothetical protein